MLISDISHLAVHGHRSTTHFEINYYLTELCLHSREDHDDGHHGSQEQEKGEHQPRDGGVIGRGTTSTQKAWC